jgi:hypothetical protein
MLKGRKCIQYSNTEKYLILKQKEEGKTWPNIARSISKATGIERSASAIQFHYAHKLRGKTSEEFEDHKPGELENLVKNKLMIQSPDYKNGNSELKQHTRELLVNKILDDSRDEMKVLSLPADNFIFEKHLQSRFKRMHPEGTIKFLCAERDEEVYNRGIAEAMDNEFHYIKADMEAILPKMSSPFQAIWLDFCCMYNGYVVKSLQTISSKNLLDDGAVLGLTLMYGREPNIYELIPFLEANEKQDTDTLRYKAFPRYVCNAIFGGKLQLHSVLRYHDLGENNQASPMLLYIFKKSEVPAEKKGVIELKYKSL